jgi:hypothetical protein
LKRGEIVPVGNALWARCPECEQPVRINKWLLGSMHLCLTENESRAKRGLPPAPER